MELVKTRTANVKSSMEKHMLAKVLLGAVTGDIDDLLHLKKFLPAVQDVPGLSDYLRKLVSDAKQRTGSALLFQRVGRQLNETAKRKMIENFLYSWAVKGSEKNKQIFLEEGTCAPKFIVLSPTMRCNLNCTGCYSGLYGKQEELTEAEIEDIIIQCRDISCNFMVISGGEPFVLKDQLFRLFRKYSDMFFMIYTNGTLIDQRTVDELADLGNVAPAISLEGYEQQTDARRGAGVYRRATRAIRALADAGVLTGASITYTRDNVEMVSTPEYIDHLIDLGAVFAWYFMFMPVGTDPVLSLVPTPKQRFACGERINTIRGTKPIFLADFWNDGPGAGGCLAAGRTYLHVLHDGSIEPCVFSHFKVQSIRDTTIKEASNCDFFRSIRKAFPYNQQGNLKRPCMIIDNPEVLRKSVQEHVASAGHEHSEDLVKDKEVMAWIDAYAEEYAQLADPLWEQVISSPDSKWYRHGEPYRNLFSREYRKV